MTQVLIDLATLEQLLVALEEVSDYINRYSIPAHQLELDPIDESIKTLNAALANAEIDALRAQLAAFAATEPAKIERKIYKDTPEYRSYLDARFTPGRLGGSFELDGHRWAYHWTSFDDAGDFALIYRWVEHKHSPMPAQGVTELVEAFEHHIEQTRPIERSTIALSKYEGAK